MAITAPRPRRQGPLDWSEGGSVSRNKPAQSCSACGAPTRKDRLATVAGVLVEPHICKACDRAAKQAANDVRARARARAIDEQWRPRKCNGCGEVKSASAFVFSKGKPTCRCRPCVNARKRRAEQGIDLGDREVDAAPDPEPARHLLDQLRAARANGEAWEQAWPDCVAYVLSCVADGNSRRDGKDRQEWSVALRDTEWAWWAAWVGLKLSGLSDAVLADAA